MDNQHNQYNFELEFKSYLQKKGYGSATVKNYSLDLRSFLLWIGGIKHEVPTVGLLQQSLTHDGITQYQLALVNKHTRPATIDRHMASVRSFALYAQHRGWIAEVPQVQVNEPRVQKMNKQYFLEQFQRSLEKEKVATATVHSYMADVKEYLTIISSPSHQ
ncbi:MAG: phage integrase N-terminal SAM-like domain-containing protein [Candidatus Roizmanbacteria bacterium]|nr:phage integrase N-terminal SAM-like domain-containing protein [Candidatus Roizmanbacteria bacterium]